MRRTGLALTFAPHVKGDEELVRFYVRSKIFFHPLEPFGGRVARIWPLLGSLLKFVKVLEHCAKWVNESVKESGRAR